jgi:transposase
MAKQRNPDPKEKALAEHGAVNPRPDKVTDELFLTHPFFDPRDIVQVKYEMLRRVRVDGWRVTLAALAFGFSRVAFYRARAAFERHGLPGLVPRRPGPRGAHKLTPERLAVLEQALTEDPSLRPADLAELAKDRLDVQIHPRTIERVMAGKKKKRK